MPIFDSLNYSYQGGSITYAQLAKYLPLIGGTITGNLYINGILSIQPSQFVIGSTTVTSTATQLNYVNVTPGTATATSALVLDSGRNVININNLGVNTVSIGSAVLNATDLGYISGTTPGTASASQALILDSSRNITNINNLTLTGLLTTPNVSITGTTDSTSISTGCLVLGGGLGLAKSLFVGSLINVSNAVGGNMLTLNCSSASGRTTLYLQSDTQNWEFGCRGSTAANPNSMYIYNGSYKLLMNSTGDTSILSTTNSTSSTTGCLKLSGGLGIASDIYCNGILNLNRNGSNISIVNGSNSGLIEVSALPNMLRCVNGYAVNIASTGVNIESSSTRAPRYALDFGATASDVIINLYQSGTNALYGIGANNSATEIHSGGDIVGYSGTTANGSLGTKLFTANSAGNIIAQAGCHSNSYSPTGLNLFGMCSHMHYSPSAGVGSFFTYNYNTSTYGITSIHNNNLYCTSNGFVTVNGGGSAANFPLDVRGSATFTTLNSFGFLSQSGSGTASTFTNRPFSAQFASGILVSSSEIDVLSDIRLKKNIIEIKEEEAERFINNCQPIEFQYKKSIDRRHYGYSAQSLIRENFPNIVGYTASDEPLEEQTIECSNGDKIELKEDVRLIVSMIDIIPLLHKALLLSNIRIKANEKEIEDLQLQINDIIDHLNNNIE